MQRVLVRLGVVLVALACVYFVATSFLATTASADSSDGYGNTSGIKKPQSLMSLRGMSKRVLDFNR